MFTVFCLTLKRGATAATLTLFKCNNCLVWRDSFSLIFSDLKFFLSRHLDSQELDHIFISFFSSILVRFFKIPVKQSGLIIGGSSKCLPLPFSDAQRRFMKLFPVRTKCEPSPLTPGSLFLGWKSHPAVSHYTQLSAEQAAAAASPLSFSMVLKSSFPLEFLAVVTTWRWRPGSSRSPFCALMFFFT